MIGSEFHTLLMALGISWTTYLIIVKKEQLNSNKAKREKMAFGVQSSTFRQTGLNSSLYQVNRLSHMGMYLQPTQLCAMLLDEEVALK